MLLLVPPIDCQHGEPEHVPRNGSRTAESTTTAGAGEEAFGETKENEVDNAFAWDFPCKPVLMPSRGLDNARIRSILAFQELNPNTMPFHSTSI